MKSWIRFEYIGSSDALATTIGAVPIAEDDRYGPTQYSWQAGDVIGVSLIVISRLIK